VAEAFASKRALTFAALLTAVALAAAALTLFATGPHGPGVNPDSVSYLDAAQNVADGKGFVTAVDQPLLTLHRSSRYTPLIHWPPLFPALLASFDRLDVSPLRADRWLNAFFFAITVALVGVIVARATRWYGAGVAAAVLVALSPVMVEQHAWLVSEPVFIFLTYLGLGLLAAHLSSPRWPVLAAAGVAFALAGLARYAAPPLVIAACAAVLLVRRGTWQTRILDAIVLTAISLLPIVGWLARNRHLTGRLSDEDLAWHPISGYRLAHGAEEATRFILSPGISPPLRGFLAAAAVGVVAVALLARHQIPREGRETAAVLAIFVVAYIAYLVLTNSLLAVDIAIDRRTLAPAYPALVMLAIWALTPLIRDFHPRTLALTALVAAVGVIGSCLVGTINKVEEIRRDGLGYSSREWRTSQTIALIRKSPSPTRLESNAPDAIYFLTGRSTRSLPARYDPHSLAPNPSYKRELFALAAAAHRGERVVLFDPRLVGRGYLADQQALVTAGLYRLETTLDGAWYGS
jgi:Dolichyl-phosphate-mannose-protein mannosyltransferase